MSRFGMSIIPQLFQGGQFYQSEADDMYKRAWAQALQQSQFNAQLAEQRRQEIRQHNIQKQQLQAQKDAQKKAERNSWLRMGIGTGAGVAAGAVTGGLAAAPAMASAAPGALGVGSEMLATTAPAVATTAAAPAAISPVVAGGTIGGGLGAASTGAPVQPMQQPMGGGYVPAPVMASPQMPTYTPFAGGNQVNGALLGGLLGGLDAIGGTNSLGYAMNLPYQNAAFGSRMALDAARLGNIGADTALTYARVGTEDAMRQPQVDTEMARAYAQNQLGNYRGEQGLTEQDLRPFRVNTEAARGDYFGSGADLRNAQIDRIYGENPLRLGELQSRIGRNESQGGAADALKLGRTTKLPYEMESLKKSIGVKESTIKKTEAETEQLKSGNKQRQPSIGYADTEKRIANAQNINDALSIIKTAEGNGSISTAEASDLRRRLGR